MRTIYFIGKGKFHEKKWITKNGKLTSPQPFDTCVIDERCEECLIQMPYYVIKSPIWWLKYFIYLVFKSKLKKDPLLLMCKELRIDGGQVRFSEAKHTGTITYLVGDVIA